MTQNERILRHLREIGCITPMEAIGQYGITKLATRVSEMKRDGHPIITTMVYGKNRFGEPTHWASYRLED